MKLLIAFELFQRLETWRIILDIGSIFIFFIFSSFFSITASICNFIRCVLLCYAFDPSFMFNGLLDRRIKLIIILTLNTCLTYMQCIEIER